MKKSIKTELSSIACTMRISTLRNWLLHIHHFSMSDLQISDMLAMIDEFQIHPQPKCIKCDAGLFARHAKIDS
jgi:hypothetical protein